MHEPVTVENDGPVTTVVLRRPHARNAVDGPTATASQPPAASVASLACGCRRVHLLDVAPASRAAADLVAQRGNAVGDLARCLRVPPLLPPESTRIAPGWLRR